MVNLSTPNSVQKLQKALHAKAKAEPDFRFYALYDKIDREDILAHAYAQCCSNKGAPGVDGQDFADIEAYPFIVTGRCGLLAARAGVRLAADKLVMNSKDTLVPASHRFEIGAPH